MLNQPRQQMTSHLKNLIGVGSFGSVYKGIMMIHDQPSVVAVKVFNLQTRGAFKSFEAECEALRHIRHRNLLKVMTVCSSTDFQGEDFKALIYEFLPHGNLHEWLHLHPVSESEKKVLDLVQRISIAIDVGSAIDYLHHHSPFPVIHCDIKPTNVLLDNNMVAQVGDFGLARFLHDNSSGSLEQSTNWAAMRGTIGYAMLLQNMDRAIIPQLKVMHITLAYYCRRCSPGKGQQIANLQKVIICISMLRSHCQIKQLMRSISTYCQ